MISWLRRICESLTQPAISEAQPLAITTYELFLCWIIVMLFVLVVGEASIIKLGVAQSDTAAQFDSRALSNDVAGLR